MEIIIGGVIIIVALLMTRRITRQPDIRPVIIIVRDEPHHRQWGCTAVWLLLIGLMTTVLLWLAAL